MNSIFYVDTAGVTRDNLTLLDITEGDRITIVRAFGVTHDNVETMITGELRTYDEVADVTRVVGLIWDAQRVLVAWDGVAFLHEYEFAALERAGFNLYNVPLYVAGGYSGHSHKAIDDTVNFIMAYESGELDDDEVTAGFQTLLDNGMVWNLQGSYQRMAQALLDAGMIRHHDKWAD